MISYIRVLHTPSIYKKYILKKSNIYTLRYHRTLYNFKRNRKFRGEIRIVNDTFKTFETLEYNYIIITVYQTL